MKETVNANIGTEAFTIDSDAYYKLKSYLDDVRCRLPKHELETMSDIELRLAEIFLERVTTSMQVVTLTMVDSAIHRMGSPSDFGEPRTSKQHTASPNDHYEPATDEEAPHKLIRSLKSRKLAGVCGGLAEYFGIDPTLIRVAMALGIFAGGITAWIYILLWIIIPEPRIHPFDINNKNSTTMTTNNKKLYRSPDGMIAGVCGGLAEFFGLDTSLMRLATLILILAGGLSLWVYIVLWLIVPRAPRRING